MEVITFLYMFRISDSISKIEKGQEFRDFFHSLDANFKISL